VGRDQVQLGGALEDEPGAREKLDLGQAGFKVQPTRREGGAAFRAGARRAPFCVDRLGEQRDGGGGRLGRRARVETEPQCDDGDEHHGGGEGGPVPTGRGCKAAGGFGREPGRSCGRAHDIVLGGVQEPVQSGLAPELRPGGGGAPEDVLQLRALGRRQLTVEVTVEQKGEAGVVHGFNWAISSLRSMHSRSAARARESVTLMALTDWARIWAISSGKCSPK